MDKSMPASYYDRRCTPYHTDQAARMKKIEAFIPTVVPHVHNCTPEMERLVTAVTDFESIIFLHTSEIGLYDSYWANFEKGYRNAYNEMRFRMIDQFHDLQQGSKKSKSLLTKTIFRLNKSQKSEYPAVATADLALLQSVMPNLQNPADFLDALKRVIIAQHICYLMQINHENLWLHVDGFEHVTRAPFFTRVFQGSADEVADSSMLSTSSFSEDEGDDLDRSSSATMKNFGLMPPTSGGRKTKSLRSAGSSASASTVASTDPTGFKTLVDVKAVYELNCKLRRDVNGMFTSPKKARDKHVDLITKMVDDVIELVHAYFTANNQCRIY